MRWDKTVRVYIEPDQPARAQTSRLRFLGVLADVLEPVGATIVHARAGSAMDQPGPSLTHEVAPLDPEGLVFRQVHHPPFWQIERQPEPHLSDVARATFDPESADAKEAEVFFHYWRDRIFGDAPYRTTRDGFALVTLTGALSRTSAGQICAPLEMLRRSFGHEPDRPIVVSLDPAQKYSNRDLALLRDFDEENPRITVRIGETKGLLRGCDYVVTQSGQTALDAALFEKPSILYAQTDAHHISLKAGDDPQAMFDIVSTTRSDYAGYVSWFLGRHAINIVADDALLRMAERLRALGWPV